MTVVINSFGKIAKRLGIEKGGPANAHLTEICYKKMDKYVPKDIGNLRDVVDLTSKSITYKSPYASYQYYGQRKDGSRVVKNYTTPGTGPRWDQRMLSAEGKDIVKEMNSYIAHGGREQ